MVRGELQKRKKTPRKDGRGQSRLNFIIAKIAPKALPLAVMIKGDLLPITARFAPNFADYKYRRSLSISYAVHTYPLDFSHLENI